MQKIFLFLILFYQHQSSVALYTPIDYMLDKLTEFVTDVADTVYQLKDKLQHVFVVQRLKQHPPLPEHALLPKPTPQLSTKPSPGSLSSSKPTSKTPSNPSPEPLSSFKPSSKPPSSPSPEDLSSSKPSLETALAPKRDIKRHFWHKMLVGKMIPKIESSLEETSKKNYKFRNKTVIEEMLIRMNENMKRAELMAEKFWKLNNIKIQAINAANAKSERFVPMPELAKKHGQSVESHKTLTKDGYQLTLHRIKPESGTANKSVLLHHGLLGSSADWILLGPNESLPYLLSASGYDVWLSNARGNYHSKKHVRLNVSTEEFWNFSWQEIGEYDLPATIDYIINFKESNESISFVGHSMGATALLALLATRPGYNDLLDIGILLAPLAFMTNIQGPLKTLSASEIGSALEILLGEKGEFLPSREVPKGLREKYCKQQDIFCRNPLFFLSGGLLQSDATSSRFIDRLMTQVPSGGSLKTLFHYLQLVRSGKFHKFGNVSLEYALKNITLPLAIFSSDDDWLAPIPDVTKLVNNIVNLVDHEIIRGKNISHTEFVWGATSETYDYLFKKIKDLLSSPPKQNFTKNYEVLNDTSIIYLLSR